MADKPNLVGRPKGSEPGSNVSTWLPGSYHDRLIQIAKTRRTTVSNVVKSIVIKELR